MGLHAQFIPSGPSCVPDAHGDGFTLTGPPSEVEPPVLDLRPTGGTRVLVRRIAVSAPREWPEALVAPLRAAWDDAAGTVVAGRVSVRGGGPALSAVPPGDWELPLRVRVHYHESGDATEDPAGAVTHTVDIGTTLHLKLARETGARTEPQPVLAGGSGERGRTGGADRSDRSGEPGHSGRDGREGREGRDGRDGATAGYGATPAADPAAGPGPVPTSAAAPGDAVSAAGTGRSRTSPNSARVFAAIDFGTSNSTVTIHDMRHLEVLAMSRHQENRLRRELAAVLADPASGGTERDRWKRILGEAARQLLPAHGAQAVRDPVRRGGPGQELAEALRSGHGGSAWLHALVTALELRLSTAGEALLSRTAPLLHACYDRAFDELPLDRLRLFPADLDQSGGTEIASRIEVTGTDPGLRVRMGEERVSVSGTDGAAPHAFRGLKQYLGRRHCVAGAPERSGGSAVTADDLIREGLRYLLDQADEYIAANPKDFNQEKIDHVVMTYPTIAPPAVRRRLHELIGTGADGIGVTVVDRQFDEAVAAALFFVMRDFGGDFAAGVEAFRARCRPLPGTTTAWQQNVMVLDIGGGTTDLALINLRLKDRTPDPAPGQDPRFTGRLHVLTPKLLGSTGHLQLGGDLMTLRLFRWFKAAFADHLLQRWPETYERVVGGLSEPYAADGRYIAGSLLGRDPEHDSYPDEMTDLVVPTRRESMGGSPPADAEQTFWLLWRMAERAKYRLGDGDAAYQPQPEEVEAVLGRVGPPEALGNGWAPRLDATAFEAILAPVIREVMDLVAALARKALNGQHLDRIVLTGKSSRMPVVSRSLRERLGEEDLISWNPAGIAVEDEYAKLATSIGACWGHHVRRFAHTERRAQGVLGRGRYVLRIEVDNLRYYLPCDFGATFQLGGGAPTDALLKAGDRLSPIGPGGTWALRSAWEDQPKSLRIHRNTGTGWTEWGGFEAENWVLRNEPGFSLDLDRWADETRFQLEVNADLFLHLHLCRGEPRLLADGVTRLTVPLRGPAARSGAEGPPEPVQIVVDTRVAGDRPDLGSVVFDLSGDPWRGTGQDQGRSQVPGHPQVPGPGPGDGQGHGRGTGQEHGLGPGQGREHGRGQDREPYGAGAGDRFDRWFRDDAMPGGTAFRGMVSRPLDSPPPDGWSFYLRHPADPDRPDELIGEIGLPGGAPGAAGHGGGEEHRHENAEYVATLDEHGRLGVHRSPVPYWSAQSLADMWHNPGSVFRVGTEDAQTAYIGERDPFNGRH